MQLNLVGAPYADPNSSESGTAYVVFGKADSAVVELADIASDSNGNGFAMHGAYKYDHVGVLSVHSMDAVS